MRSGTYERSLATVAWSPVEPQLAKKWYAAGIGEIQEQVAVMSASSPSP